MSAQRRFSYDRWGNRTGVWDAVSGGNQIQSVTLDQPGGTPTNRFQSVTTSGVTKNYTYDVAGNITNDGTHTYIYNGDNQLSAVDWGQANGYSYAFDPQNRRIKRANYGTGAWTHSVWEGSQVIAEYNQTGGVIGSYYYSGSRMIRNDLAGVGTRTYLSDRLSIRATLDTNGNVVGRQGHLPYGEEIGTSGELDKHRFTSYERDNESGMDYAMNRSYSPSVGRFQQADPYRASGGVNDPQSWNRYAYVQNSPIAFTDRSGLFLENELEGLCDGSMLGEIFCESLFVAAIGIRMITEPDPTPTCRQALQAKYPSSQDAIAVLYTLMHEIPGYWYTGQPTYRKGDREGSPTGDPYSGDKMHEEAVAMATAIANRAAAIRRSIYDTVKDDRYINGRDETGKMLNAEQWYRKGESQVMRALITAKDSPDCIRLERLVDATNLVVRDGYRIFSGEYQWWKSVASFVSRPETRDWYYVRIGFHDFANFPGARPPS